MARKELTEQQAAMQSKCPRCRTGEMFTGRVYGLKVQKMNEFCPHCHLKFEQRPGHFYVAMFVSYAMVVAEIIIACLLTYVITGNDSSFWLYLVVSLSASLLFAPFNYRYSRVILMYWLTPGIRYRSESVRDTASGEEAKPGR